jgi:hypothetical protein
VKPRKEALAVLGWLAWAYAVVELLLIAASGYAALAVRNTGRRRDAYKVLRLMLTAGAASGLAGLLVKLHELGLLR